MRRAKLTSASASSWLPWVTPDRHGWRSSDPGPHPLQGRRRRACRFSASCAAPGPHLSQSRWKRCSCNTHDATTPTTRRTEGSLRRRAWGRRSNPAAARTARTPKGLALRAAPRWPPMAALTLVVIPHNGHGTPVNVLSGQGTPGLPGRWGSAAPRASMAAPAQRNGARSKSMDDDIARATAGFVGRCEPSPATIASPTLTRYGLVGTTGTHSIWKVMNFGSGVGSVW